MVARWRAMAGYTDAHAATLRRCLADGRVACRAPVDRVVDILAELLARPTRTGRCWRRSRAPGPRDTGRDRDGWSTAERERFATACGPPSPTRSGRPSPASTTRS